jgi:hypothetical protein
MNIFEVVIAFYQSEGRDKGKSTSRWKAGR